MNKQEQRTFGITENLLKKPVPKFYGAGEHKVQLAYITPAEAELLGDLDLHGSNPPNPGPEGIPNFNDPGTGMSGAQASAAERDPRDRSRREQRDLAVGSSFGPSFGGGQGPSGQPGFTQADVAGIAAGAQAAAQGQAASQAFQGGQAPVSAAPEVIEPEEKKNFFQKFFTSQTPAQQIMTKIEAMHPRFQTQLLKGLFGDEFDEGDFGQIDTDAALAKLSGMTSALESAYDTSNLSGAEILSALRDPGTYLQSAMSLPYGGPMGIASMALPVKGLELVYGLATDRPYNLADMSNWETSSTPPGMEQMNYMANVSNFNPGMMQDLQNIQGNLTDLQMGQYISGNLMDQSDFESTRQNKIQDLYTPPVTTSEQLTGPTETPSTADQIDYQSLYSEFTPAQKETADKIAGIYDLPYAVSYVIGGGPLF